MFFRILRKKSRNFSLAYDLMSSLINLFNKYIFRVSYILDFMLDTGYPVENKIYLVLVYRT